jgi:hypothetical protein
VEDGTSGTAIGAGGECMATAIAGAAGGIGVADGAGCVDSMGCAGPSKLSCPEFPSVMDVGATPPLTAGLGTLIESAGRRKTKKPIKDPITIAAAIPPTTPPINAPLLLLLLSVDSTVSVGVAPRGRIGAATAGGFVDGRICTSDGDKVGNKEGLVVFITTVGEGETTGAADTYRVKHPTSILDSHKSSVVMATLDIICGLDEVEPEANVLDALHPCLLEVLLNRVLSVSTTNWAVDSVQSK